MYFNENAIKNKIQTYKNKIWCFFERLTESAEEREMAEKRLDQEGRESFPASDAPAHRSKSMEDHALRH